MVLPSRVFMCKCASTDSGLKLSVQVRFSSRPQLPYSTWLLVSPRPNLRQGSAPGVEALPEALLQNPVRSPARLAVAGASSVLGGSLPRRRRQVWSQTTPAAPRACRAHHPKVSGQCCPRTEEDQCPTSQQVHHPPHLRWSRHPTRLCDPKPPHPFTLLWVIPRSQLQRHPRRQLLERCQACRPPEWDPLSPSLTPVPASNSALREAGLYDLRLHRRAQASLLPWQWWRFLTVTARRLPVIYRHRVCEDRSHDLRDPPTKRRDCGCPDSITDGLSAHRMFFRLHGLPSKKLHPAWYIWSPPTLPSCVVLSWLPVPGPRIVVFRRLLNSLMCCTSPGTRRWSSVGLLLILLRSPSALEWSTTQTTLQLLREVALFLRGALMLGGSPPTVALLGGSPPLPYGTQVGSSSLLAVVYPYPSGQPVSCTSSVLYLHRVR